MTIYPDADTRNADWPKRTNDVWDGTVNPKGKDTPDEPVVAHQKTDDELYAEYMAALEAEE